MQQGDSAVADQSAAVDSRRVAWQDAARHWLSWPMRFVPVPGLRWRLGLLLIVAWAPSLVLFLHHAQTGRATVLQEAQGRALRLARTWADNHDALLREAH